jgi:hypothetical protein
VAPRFCDHANLSSGGQVRGTVNKIGGAFIKPATDPGIEDAIHGKHAGGHAAKRSWMRGILRIVSPDMYPFHQRRKTRKPSESQADASDCITRATEATAVALTSIDAPVSRPSGRPKIASAFAGSIRQPDEVLKIPIRAFNHGAMPV